MTNVEKVHEQLLMIVSYLQNFVVNQGMVVMKQKGRLDSRNKDIKKEGKNLPKAHLLLQTLAGRSGRVPPSQHSGFVQGRLVSGHLPLTLLSLSFCDLERV